MTFSNRAFRSLTITALLLGLLGCAGMKKRGGHSGSRGGSSELQLSGDSDSNTAGGLQTVYFAFNSATLSSETRSMLDANAEYLKGNGDIKIQIEGHCDERGGVQYNLALGEKRANATRDYLVSMGVSSSRVDTISLGKEKPRAFGHDESAWGQNRRSNFVITAK